MIKRKMVVGAGIFLMVTAMLGGCGKVTAEKLLEEAAGNSQKATSVKGDMEMNMGMDVGQSGFSFGLDLGMSGDFEATNEPSVFHMDGGMNISLMNMSLDMESYSVHEDNKVTSYTKVADTWTKSEQELDKKSEKNTSMLPVFDSETKLELAEELEKVNDQDAYVITATLTGDALKKMMESSSEMLDMNEVDMDEADFSEVSADVIMKIYKKNKLPAYMSVKFTDGLEDLIDSEAQDEAAAELNKLDVELNFKEYDTVDKIEVPQEALKAEENSTDNSSIFGALNQEDDMNQGLLDKLDDSAEGQAADADEDTKTDADEMTADAVRTDDGAYILTDYEKDVQVEIKIPEGFSDKDTYSSSTNVSFAQMSDDSSSGAFVSYGIQEVSEYYTPDMVYAYMGENKEFYEKDGNYKDIQYQAPMDIKVGDRAVKYASLSYSYSDGSFTTYEQRFWTKIDDEHLLECQINESTYGTAPVIPLDQEAGELLLSGVTF